MKGIKMRRTEDRELSQWFRDAVIDYKVVDRLNIYREGINNICYQDYDLEEER